MAAAPMVSPSVKGLTITNPLVLYRALLATKNLDPDPSQHRLALHLEKLYYRLKDYEPKLEYKQRLAEITRTVDRAPTSTLNQGKVSPSTNHGHKSFGVFAALRARRENKDTVALTVSMTDHQRAMHLDSPQGLLLYGEVGTGKSMLVDLLADCLPNRKKRRWHFDTFMLDLISRLARLQFDRAATISNRPGVPVPEQEYALLHVARDMISTSPILFLDEFQMPDRAGAKLLSNLLTSFFQLGGVLIATSNRMPEELAKAQGIEFTSGPASSASSPRGRWSLGGTTSANGTSADTSSWMKDYTGFLEVLKARCETWDMEGGRDWRRREAEDHESLDNAKGRSSQSENCTLSFNGLEGLVPGNVGLGFEQSAHTGSSSVDAVLESKPSRGVLPKKFHIIPSASSPDEIETQDRNWETAVKNAVSPGKEISWETSQVRVYGRNVFISHQHNGCIMWNFKDLCASNLGPADYITLASTFHTLILDDIPRLTLLQKNEARRFITLLDALYESRCKLLVRAEAGPDEIFFSESNHPFVDSEHSEASRQDNDNQDQTYPETFAEVYQDLTSPFRPNISTYSTESIPSALNSSSLPYNSEASRGPFPRSIPEDIDSDFGPLNPRRFDGIPGAGNEIGRQGPNFTNTGSFTGEDERFAYKRARSRLWEMCGERWWARSEEGWWKPVEKDVRRWEGNSDCVTAQPFVSADGVRGDEQDKAFPHGASPFRTHQDPPPKFNWVHAWGMMTWGKKAGAWGKGPAGLKDKENKSKSDA